MWGRVMVGLGGFWKETIWGGGQHLIPNFEMQFFSFLNFFERVGGGKGGGFSLIYL